MPTEDSVPTPVIDFRLRPPFKSYHELSIFDKGSLDNYSRKGVQPPPSFLESDMDLLLEEMDEAHVIAGVALGRKAAPAYGTVSNEDIAELIERYPKRFIPFGGVDMSVPPRSGSSVSGARSVAQRVIAEVDYVLDDLGFVGVAVDPGWLDPPRHADDPTLYPLYAHCAERDVAIAVTMSIFVGPDLTYSNPTAIQRVAKDFPGLQIVVPHAAWPWVTQFLGACFTAKNIWVSPDFYGHVPNMPGALHFAEAANYYLENRLLYASAYPARPLADSIREFRDLPIRPDVQRKSLFDNAVELLGEAVPWLAKEMT